MKKVVILGFLLLMMGLVACTNSLEPTIYHTVVFNSMGGGDVLPQTIEHGSSISWQEPEKHGHTFVNWYNEETYITPFTTSSVVLQDLTLYAKWQANEYTVTFEVDGGMSLTPLTVLFGDWFEAPEALKTGHAFIGWYRDASFSTPFLPLSMPAEDFILYAKWEHLEYPLNVYGIGEVHFSAISAGGSHTMGLTDIGNVYVWGYNEDGQVGDGTTITRHAPIRITPLFNLGNDETIIKIAAGRNHSLALSSENRLFTWGSNWRGQIGDGSGDNRLIPTDITSFFSFTDDEYIVDAASGNEHVVVLTSLGRVFSFGANRSGQLGDGTDTDSPTPVDITWNLGLDAEEVVVKVTAKGIQSFLLTSKDRLFELGYMEMIDPMDITEDFAFEEDEVIKDMVLGISFRFVITSENRIFGWGQNTNGQVGDGTTWDQFYPMDITARFGLDEDDELIEMVAGSEHTLAVSAKGRVFAWGFNDGGRLGDGTAVDKHSPFDITEYLDLEDETVVMVAAGGAHSMVLTSNGYIITWGLNTRGQLGSGISTQCYDPDEITDNFALQEDDIISDMYAGLQFSAGLTSSGQLFMWGSNYFGQLGEGTYVSHHLPVDIMFNMPMAEGEHIDIVAMGQTHMLVLTTDGMLLAWGHNGHGQLGNNISSPFGSGFANPHIINYSFTLSEGDRFIKISAGDVHSIALTEFGRVFTWGGNAVGQLGNGTTSGFWDKHPLPIDITNRFDLNENEIVVEVKAGTDHSMALTSDGRVFTWGGNSRGQLGINLTYNLSSPYDITDNFFIAVEDTIVQIYASIRYSVAMTREGTIFTWGENGAGQLADGTNTNRLLPVDVTGSFALYPTDKILKLSLGYGHGFALTHENRVYAWGSNFAGRLGDGTLEDTLIPIEVTQQFSLDSALIVDVSAGGNHSFAVASDGKVFAWGGNSDGQLGCCDLFSHVKLAVYGYGIGTSDTILYDAPITLPTPERNGYTFEGWYTDTEFTQLFTYTTMPAYSLSAYPKWQEAQE